MHINTPVVTKDILLWTGQEKALSAPPVILSVELVSGETTTSRPQQMGATDEDKLLNQSWNKILSTYGITLDPF